MSSADPALGGPAPGALATATAPLTIGEALGQVAPGAQTNRSQLP